MLPDDPSLSSMQPLPQMAPEGSAIPEAPNGIEPAPAAAPEIVVASKSVRGHSHLSTGKPCQDSSFVQADGAGKWRVVVVSDGHGDSNCMRSDRGSKLAVECATSSLVEFARAACGEDEVGETLARDLLVPTRRATVVRRITDAIIARWRAAVQEDVSQDPLTPEELAEASERARERYERGERLEHAYGATLVAALWLPKALLLLQQGDGLCLVIDREGTASQPVPEDERCLANVTTSLCDEDAADAIRHAVVPLEERAMAACVLASDGVANSFADDEGAEAYAKSLLINLAQDGNAWRLSLELEQSLPELSQRGSGDDMSVALAADVVAVRALVDTFEAGVERQQLEARIEALRNKGTSMQRKHDVLAKRRDEHLAQKERLAQEVRDCEQELRDLCEQADDAYATVGECAQRRDSLAAGVEAARRALRARGDAAPVLRIGNYVVRLVDKDRRALAKRERQYGEALLALDEACERYDELVAAASEAQDRMASVQEELSGLSDAPVREYEQYDEQYRQIFDELAQCEAQLASWDGKGEEQRWDS